jgi:hypothetical protein
MPRWTGLGLVVVASEAGAAAVAQRVGGREAIHPAGGVVPDLVRGVVDEHEHRAASLLACPGLGRIGRPERVRDVDGDRALKQPLGSPAHLRRRRSSPASRVSRRTRLRLVRMPRLRCRRAHTLRWPSPTHGDSSRSRRIAASQLRVGQRADRAGTTRAGCRPRAAAHPPCAAQQAGAGRPLAPAATSTRPARGEELLPPAGDPSGRLPALTSEQIERLAPQQTQHLAPCGARSSAPHGSPPARRSPRRSAASPPPSHPSPGPPTSRPPRSNRVSGRNRERGRERPRQDREGRKAAN